MNVMNVMKVVYILGKLQFDPWRLSVYYTVTCLSPYRPIATNEAAASNCLSPLGHLQGWFWMKLRDTLQGTNISHL